MSPEISPTRGGLLYNTWEDEAIYRITNDGTYQTALSWSLGNLKMPYIGLNDYARFLREKDRYVLDISARETRNNWFLHFAYKGIQQMAVVNKLTGDQYLVANPDTAQKGVYNDIDGGPSFWPMWDNESDKQFIRLVHAIDLLDNKDARNSSKLPIKNPGQSAVLKRILSGLNENSNPVVMLVTLK